MLIIVRGLHDRAHGAGSDASYASAARRINDALPDTTNRYTPWLSSLKYDFLVSYRVSSRIFLSLYRSFSSPPNEIYSIRLRSFVSFRPALALSDACEVKTVYKFDQSRMHHARRWWAIVLQDKNRSFEHSSLFSIDAFETASVPVGTDTLRFARRGPTPRVSFGRCRALAGVTPRRSFRRTDVCSIRSVDVQRVSSLINTLDF